MAAQHKNVIDLAQVAEMRLNHSGQLVPYIPDNTRKRKGRSWTRARWQMRDLKLVGLRWLVRVPAMHACERACAAR